MKCNDRIESEKMLEIIHENHKKQLEKKVVTKSLINVLGLVKGILIIVLSVLFIIACIYLTQDRKKAIKNCMKNHSQNYCERISG